MKRFKINVAVLALLFGATTAFAFNAPSAGTNSKAGLVWYKFNGGDQSNPGNYSRMSSTPTCNGTADLCAIQGNDDGTQPSQTTVNSPSAERFLQ